MMLFINRKYKYKKVKYFLQMVKRLGTITVFLSVIHIESTVFTAFYIIQLIFTLLCFV